MLGNCHTIYIRQGRGSFMTTLEIVENNLKFLTTEYGFVFSHSNSQGDHYIFKNRHGYIEFYEWEQFQDSAVFVNYDMTSKKIDLFLEYPKIVGKFNHNHRGIKWLFKDKRQDYWEMVATVIRMEIENHKSVFGLNVEKQLQNNVYPNA